MDVVFGDFSGIRNLSLKGFNLDVTILSCECLRCVVLVKFLQCEMCAISKVFTMCEMCY